MIEPIVIKVTDKVPEIISGPEYAVCDNSDYIVVWQLDEEWAQFEHRTMQVNYKDGTYERVLFTGDSCTLTAIPVPGPVHVGLFAGDIHTTRPARLLAVRSATTDCGEEREPMPNGYAQAIQALDAKLDKNQGAENAGKAMVVDAEGNVVPGKAQGSSLPAMSADTKGKMLTNDGGKAEWGDVPKEVMVVNFTQGDDGDWSADKNWDEVAALIESGGLVYAVNNSDFLPLIGYLKAQDEITFQLIQPTPFDIINHIFYWKQNGTIESFSASLAVVKYSVQRLDAGQKAQARANIGLTPVAKTDAMTQSVGLDAETGELYTTPAAGDNTLGITSATVGQIAKITAVDADGRPTAWEAVDMAGGGETWEEIRTLELSEDVAKVTISTDNLGNTFALKSAFIKIKAVPPTSESIIYNASVCVDTTGQDPWGANKVVLGESPKYGEANDMHLFSIWGTYAGKFIPIFIKRPQGQSTSRILTSGLQNDYAGAGAINFFNGDIQQESPCSSLCFGSYKTALYSGTVIKIYGVRV